MFDDTFVQGLLDKYAPTTDDGPATAVPSDPSSDVGSSDSLEAPSPDPTPDLVHDETNEDIVRRKAKEYKVDPELALAMMAQESRGKTKATSWKGAGGPMQLEPGTAKRFGVTDVYNAEQNIDGGVRYLRSLLDKFGDTNEGKKKAIAAYNLGENSKLLNGPNWWSRIQYASNDPDVQAGRKPRGATDKTNTQNYVKNIWSNYQGKKGPTSMGYGIDEAFVKGLADKYATPSADTKQPDGTQYLKPGDPVAQDTTEPQPALDDTFFKDLLDKHASEDVTPQQLADAGAAPEYINSLLPHDAKQEDDAVAHADAAAAVVRKQKVAAAQKVRPPTPVGTVPEFVKTGEVVIPATDHSQEEKLKYDPADQDGLQSGEYRLHDTDGNAYIYNGGKLVAEADTETVKQVDVPLGDPGANLGVVKRVQGEAVADALADVTKVPKQDIVDYFASHGMRNLDTGEEFKPEEYFKPKGFTNPMTGLSDQPGTSPFKVTKRDLMNIEAFSAQRDLERQKFSATGSAVVDGAPSEETVINAGKMANSMRPGGEASDTLAGMFGALGGVLKDTPEFNTFMGGMFGSGGGGIAKDVAGVMRVHPFSAIPAFQEATKAVSQLGSEAELAGQLTQVQSGNGWKAYALNMGGRLPADLAVLGLGSALGLGPTALFASSAGAQSLGSGDSLGKAAVKSTEGGLIGTVFGFAPKASIIAKATAGALGADAESALYSLIGHGTEIGTIAGGTGLVTKAFGASNKDALSAILTNSMFHIVGTAGGSIPKVAGRIFRFWKGGVKHDVSVDPAGVVQEHSNVPDNLVETEVVLDKDNPVYRSTDPASPEYQKPGVRDYLKDFKGSLERRRVAVDAQRHTINFVDPDTGDTTSYVIPTELRSLAADEMALNDKADKAFRKLKPPSENASDEEVNSFWDTPEAQAYAEIDKAADAKLAELQTALENYKAVEPGPIPETPEALAAQSKSAADPNQTERIAVMYAGEQASTAPAPVKGKEFKIVSPNGDVIIVDQAGWKAKAKELGVPGTKSGLIQYTNAGADKLAVQELLGRKEVVADTSTGAAVTATEDGKQVDAAVVSSPETADAQAASYAEQHPAAEVAVVPTQEAAAQRVADHVDIPQNPDGTVPVDQLPAVGSRLASGINDGMYDTLWAKVEAGDITELGSPSAILQVAKAIRDKGGLKTIDELKALGQDFGAINSKGKQRQKDLTALAKKYIDAIPSQDTSYSPDDTADIPPEVQEAPVKDAKIVGGGEVTRELQQRDEALRQSEVDPLTGMANRAALDKALPKAESDPNTAIIAFDANNFGQINKKVSQEAGDSALKDIANAITQAAKESGVTRVFRRGGDEMVVIAPKGVADTIRARAEEIYGESDYGGVKVSLTGTHGDTFNEADATLQDAKAARKAQQQAVVDEPVVTKPSLEQGSRLSVDGKDYTITKVLKGSKTAEAKYELTNDKGKAFWTNEAFLKDATALPPLESAPEAPAVEAPTEEPTVTEPVTKADEPVEAEHKPIPFDKPEVVPPVEPPAKPVSDDVKLLNDDIEYAQNQIEDHQSEIEMVKGNIDDARAKRDAALKEVRANKALSKEEREDKIEEIKGEYEDAKNDIDDEIDGHKEEIAQHKKDLKAAQKKLAKLQAAAPSSDSLEPVKPDPPISAEVPLSPVEQQEVAAAAPEVAPEVTPEDTSAAEAPKKESELPQPAKPVAAYKEGDTVHSKKGVEGSIDTVLDKDTALIQWYDKEGEPAGEPMEYPLASLAKDWEGEGGFLNIDLNWLKTVPEQYKKLKDFFSLEVIPRLSEAGLSVPARQHAYARVSTDPIVKDLLAKVFPMDYKDADKMASVMNTMVKDNILGGYDAFRRYESQAIQRGDFDKAMKWGRKADDIRSAHNLAQMRQDVINSQDDPFIVESIANWREHVNPYLDALYEKAKGVDPGTYRDPRGAIYGARVNLMTKVREGEMKNFGRMDKTMPEGSPSSYRNPDAKRDKFDRSASFTGDYSTDAQAMLTNTLGPRLNTATLLDFYKAINDSGHGLLDMDNTRPTEINGKEVVRMPVKVPVTNEDGYTIQKEVGLYVPKDMVKEIRNIVNTDQPVKEVWLLKALTQLQLMQLTDGVAHIKNVHTVVANALGRENMLLDITNKLPVLSSADAITRLALKAGKVAADTPEIREQMADMAKLGLLRAEHPRGKMDILRMGSFIHYTDTAARMIMNDFYDQLVKRGAVTESPEERIKFIQQVGEYNSRMLGDGMRNLKQMGLSPFVVAGRTFNRQGRRIMTGDPGVTGADKVEAAKMRAINLGSGVAMTIAIPGIINYLTVGDPKGRPGTPLGAIDLGRKADDHGNHDILDLAQLTGLRRGMRSTGVDALASGLMEGQSAGDIAAKAKTDIVTNALHPWIGPGIAAIFSGLTGTRLDLRGGPTPVEARRMDTALGQQWEYARVALKNQNSLLYGLASTIPGVKKIVGSDQDLDSHWYERILTGVGEAPMRSLGYRSVNDPANRAASDIYRSKGSIATTEKGDEQRVILKGYKTREEAGDQTVDADIKRDVMAGKITFEQVKQMKSNAQLDPLAVKLKYLDLFPDAMKVWNLMDVDQKKATFPVMLGKAADMLSRTQATDDEIKQLQDIGITPESISNAHAVFVDKVLKESKLADAEAAKSKGDTTLFDALNSKEKKGIVKQETLSQKQEEFSGKGTPQKLLIFSNASIDDKAEQAPFIRKLITALSTQKNKTYSEQSQLTEARSAMEKYERERSALPVDQQNKIAAADQQVTIVLQKQPKKSNYNRGAGGKSKGSYR